MNFLGDYKSLEGQNIPFRQLGFTTLENCIQNVPGIKTSRRGGDLWIEIIPTQETLHISKLVAGQKAPKARRKKPVILFFCWTFEFIYFSGACEPRFFSFYYDFK